MTKTCEQCGNEFDRKRLRTDAQWASQRYCSQRCSHDARRDEPLADRLWRRVEAMPSGCWEWRGYVRPHGYGQLGAPNGQGRTIDAHRAAWIVTHGAIPDGLFVCHHCDNRLCCNPDHLFIGTHQDNMRDMVAKGRNAKGDRLPHTKLTDEQVKEIRARYVAKWSAPRRGGRRSNAPELAADFGITPIYVQQLVYGMYRKDA